ncbi:hypothetical protein [Calothrix sp. UHCC 0171]|uniref:hypothetical protein n=1 Tax=Calothrix sp. UHCC 0171 TaxID=3110245 RepID=UPI002B218BEA|nr:hypothetical protein [Calothrix sp. UHCC 0171]MEA5569770.1 hypothetical protein [Calothrix sp. UHCC 0171]
MSRLLYEHSVSYRGYLVIPFAFPKTSDTPLGSGYRQQKIYSYKLLAENGSKDKLHKAENPSGFYSDSIERIVNIAKEYIDNNLDFIGKGDAFKCRYTYRNNLIIVSQEAGKYYYDHYPPESLNNIAAPKIFKSEFDCISWIKEGIDGLHLKRRVG